MSAKKLVNVRVLEAEKKRWDAEAKRQGVSLSEFVRSSVGARIGGSFKLEPEAPRKGGAGASLGERGAARSGPSPGSSSPEPETDSEPLADWEDEKKAAEPETAPSVVPAPAPPGSAGRSRPCVHRVPVTEKCRFGCDG